MHGRRAHPRYPWPPVLARQRGTTGQRDKLSAANEQISHLNGRSLDPLTIKELQELRGVLKKALNNTERQIDLR